MTDKQQTNLRLSWEVVYWVIIPLSIAFIASYAILSFISESLSPPDALFRFYEDKLRSSLFSAFITAGSFLFSVKTFAIFRLHDEVYATLEYMKQHLEDINLGETKSYLAPLNNFSNYLFSSILLSFFTSVTQLTIGIIHSNVSANICISLAFASIVSVVISLILLKYNLCVWFEIKSDIYRDKLEKIKNDQQQE